MSFTMKKEQVGSLLKLNCLVSMTDQNIERISEEINVNDLAMLRLKLEFNNNFLNCFVNAKTRTKGSLIKVKVHCYKYYSEWICTDDGQYKKVTEYSFHLSHLKTYNKFKDMHSGLLTITISASKVFSGLPVKLYNDEDFTDFHLSSSEGSVPIHRSCLAARSDVFKTMLSREWKETKEGRIQIEGVTLETLQHLKQYMYLGDLPSNGLHLQSLLLVASCYLMEDLKAECVLKLALTVKPEELYSLLKFAFENELPELTFALIKATPDKVVEDAENIHMKKKVEEETKDE